MQRINVKMFYISFKFCLMNINEWVETGVPGVKPPARGPPNWICVVDERNCALISKLK